MRTYSGAGPIFGNEAFKDYLPKLEVSCQYRCKIVHFLTSKIANFQKSRKKVAALGKKSVLVLQNATPSF